MHNKYPRRVALDFLPEQLLEVFSVKNGIWKVECPGLPSDYKVLGIEFNVRRQVVTFILETENPDRFFMLGKYQEPPCVDLYGKVELVGNFDSDPSPQRSGEYERVARRVGQDDPTD